MAEFASKPTLHAFTGIHISNVHSDCDFDHIRKTFPMSWIGLFTDSI